MPQDAALVVIDVQKGFDDPGWDSRNNPEAEDNIALLLAEWRSSGRPVIHVQHDSTILNGFFRPGTPGNTVKAQALPRSNEPVYRKNVNSAFIGTTCEADLRARGVATVVIVGLTTNHCVSTTARMAGSLGFRTIVVEDATATFDRPALTGVLRPAGEVHASALSDLRHEFALITDTRTIVDALGGTIR